MMGARAAATRTRRGTTTRRRCGSPRETRNGARDLLQASLNVAPRAAPDGLHPDGLPRVVARREARVEQQPCVLCAPCDHCGLHPELLLRRRDHISPAPAAGRFPPVARSPGAPRVAFALSGRFGQMTIPSCSEHSQSTRSTRGDQGARAARAAGGPRPRVTTDRPRLRRAARAPWSTARAARLRCTLSTTRASAGQGDRSRQKRPQATRATRRPGETVRPRGSHPAA